MSLPPASITVVHRSDGSGTTYIFSNYLSSADPTWAAKVGTGKTLNWPAGEGAEGNGSVTSTVFRTPFSIGYVEQAYSQGLVLPFAAIRNQAGNYVLPSTQTVAAAAAQKPHITPADFSIVNQPGASSYPISGYSWALIYTHQNSQATGQTTRQHAGLAHPRRPGLRRREPLRAPAIPGPATRPHDAPEGHRTHWDTPAELTVPGRHRCAARRKCKEDTRGLPSASPGFGQRDESARLLLCLLMLPGSRMAPFY